MKSDLGDESDIVKLTQPSGGLLLKFSCYFQASSPPRDLPLYSQIMAFVGSILKGSLGEASLRLYTTKVAHAIATSHQGNHTPNQDN